MLVVSHWLEPHSWTAYHFLLEYYVLLALAIMQAHHQLTAIILLVHIVSWAFYPTNDTAAQDPQIILPDTVAFAQHERVDSTEVGIVGIGPQ